jgi:hypothetical protein
MTVLYFVRFILRVLAALIASPVIAAVYGAKYWRFKNALRRGMVQSGIPPALARLLAKEFKIFGKNGNDKRF